MAFQQLREKARALRKQGKSIAEISTSLSSSKSTVSYWCRDISLSKPQQHILFQRQKERGGVGRLRAAEKKRAQRIEKTRDAMNHGARDVAQLSQRDVFILGLALYWGEGYKSGNEECGLTNSDPAIIRVFIAWIKRVYGVSAPDLILRVSLNETHRDRTDVVQKYWSQMTGISQSQFTKISLIKARVKKTYANTEEHFGTLRVKVRRGTALRRRIMGSIEALKKQFAK